MFMTNGLTRRERLRRVVLLCCHFTRNLAYYRAGIGLLTKASPQFWLTANTNFIDTAVMEWCKLLGDEKANHFWANVVSDASSFETDMLDHVGLTADEHAAYINEMRTYRDKFLAHLDDLPDMDIPTLDEAKATVEFYCRYIVSQEAAYDLAGLPVDLVDYYLDCFKEAAAIYERCSLRS
jgi:hypothetical protein